MHITRARTNAQRAGNVQPIWSRSVICLSFQSCVIVACSIYGCFEDKRLWSVLHVGELWSSKELYFIYCIMVCCVKECDLLLSNPALTLTLFIYLFISNEKFRNLSGELGPIVKMVAEMKGNLDGPGMKISR